MKRAFVVAAAAIVAAVLTVTGAGAVATPQASKGAASRSAKQIDDLTLELVGQVINSAPGVTPATSAQFGYVAYLRGLPIFKEGPQDEKTALFTFYTETTGLRVIANGPLRIISREGTVTIYDDPSANGTFANPDSFRDGKPILVGGLRQQVIVDTATGAFTAQNLNTITATSSFQGPSGTLQLGKVGDQFRTVIAGHVNAAGPPSAYMAGYTFSDPSPRGRS
jgi:hypothetical protein